MKAAWLLVFTLLALPAFGQQRPLVAPKPPDTTQKARPSGLPGAPKEAVQFFAADSAIFLLGDSTRITLFGRAKLEHESGTLSAQRVDLNTATHVMEAKAESDADSLGRPLLKRENDEIRSRRILYNYKTGKGKFESARVNIQEGALQGEQVKRAEPHVVYVAQGMYSTCMLDHPHFYIRAQKMKVVDEEEIFFTRARLYLLDIPYPLLLPFGYVPAKWDKKRSGLLAPTFQNQNLATRGYGLTNLGWFQYFNDHLTGTFAFGAFTTGTWNSDVVLQYRKTDQYSGQFRFGQSFERGFEPTDRDFRSIWQRNFTLSHAQDFSPWSKVTANLNYRTADYFRRNSTNLPELAQPAATSSASWNYNAPDGLFSLTTNYQQVQYFQNNRVEISGPALNFSLRRFTPFRPVGAASKPNAPFYESLTVGYNSNFSSNFTYAPIAADSATVSWIEALLRPSLYRQNHNFAQSPSNRHVNAGYVQRISMDSKLLPGQYVQLNGNMSFNEYWYPATIRKSWDATAKRIVTSSVPGFASGRDYQFGLNLNTTLYGISNRKIGRFDGFRHTLRPAVGLSWRPDFSTSGFGFYREVQADSAGTRFQKYSIFEGGSVGGPSLGESRSINLSLNNVFETRLSRRDTTGEQRREVIRLIDDLSFRTGYNFSANQFKLSDLGYSITSNILRSIRLNANGAFSFYATDTLGNRVDRYLWNERRRPMRLKSFTFNTGTSFSEGAMNPSRELPFHPARYDPLNQDDFRDIDPLLQRQSAVRWDIPWSVGINVSYSYNASNPKRITRSALINASDIRFLLTPKWQVATSLGYDFIQKELTPARFQINRNLHCWDLSMDWAPFGPFKYFIFRLNINSGQFQNLFQKLPGLNSLNTSSGRNSRF